METDRDEFEEFEAGGLSWRAERAHAAAVRAEIAGRLDELCAPRGAEVLKRNLSRTVLRVPLAAGGRVIVKRYAVGGVLDWIKYAVVPSRAQAEWSTGRGLDAAGIPTAVPLAMAERRRLVLRDAALVTREIAGALHLNAYVAAHFRGAAPDPLRARLFEELARTVRRMHDAGYVHNDLHGGNILVNEAPESARLHIIDLHSVSHSVRPSPGARWFDLVKLLHSMLTCSTEEERAGICRAYEETGGPSGTRVAALLETGRLSAQLEPQLTQMEARRVKSRTERALTRSSKFDATRVDGFLVRHLRVVPAGSLPGLFAAHRRSLAVHGTEVLKDARRSALTRQTLVVDGSARSVIVKEYRGRTVGERLKNTFRRPRAIAAWLAGNGLLVRRFDAAEPLALAVRGRGPALTESFLVMDDAGEDARADLVVLARYAGTLDAAARREKRALVLAVARLFRELHAAGVYHGDLKAVNLFLEETRSGPHVVLADYDRVEFGAEVPERRRIKNLAQLSASVAICISLADRLRFFREYAKNDPAALAQWKNWFRRVVDACRQKIVVRMKPIE